MFDTSSVTTDAAPRREARWAVRAGNAAFVWGLLFAVAHVYWACGGTALVEAGQAREARAHLERDPWGYVISWMILSLLFVFMGSFPLALVWPEGRRVSRRRVQAGAIVLGYAGMASLAIHGAVTREPGLIVVGGGAGVLGGLVAVARPRSQPVARWMVLVVTWVMGVAMLVYGGAYVTAAMGERGSERFVIYLVTGGASWLSGGVLFVAAAWQVGRRVNGTGPHGHPRSPVLSRC